MQSLALCVAEISYVRGGGDDANKAQVHLKAVDDLVPYPAYTRDVTALPPFTMPTPESIILSP